MFQNLSQNLTKNQKIGVVVVIQIIIILLIVVWANTLLQPRTHVDVVNEETTNIPDSDWQGVKDELWNLVQSNVAGVTQADVNDVVIREGTYTETTENEITTAKFLIDIDSLKQTYAVVVSWSDSVELYDSISIDCPTLDQMKYPETVCYGRTNNTYSLDLYLPHAVYPEGRNTDEGYPTAPNYIIHGDENTKTIDIEVSACDPDKFKSDALEYLGTTPINLTDYTVNYNINTVDVGC